MDRRTKEQVVSELHEKLGKAKLGVLTSFNRMNVVKMEALRHTMRKSSAEVKVVKNKVAPPFRKARFDLMFNTGISTEGEILEIAEGANIITKAGAWYSYGDVRMGQGRENSKQFLRDNPDIFSEIVIKVKKSLGMIKEPEAEEVTEKAVENKKTAKK